MTEKDYHHGNLREELIRKGLVLLNKSGVEDFSLRKVASMCSVSHNAPYRHFQAKEDLIHEIVMTAVDKFREALSAALEAHPDDPEKQLFGIGIAYINFFTMNPEYLSLFFNSGAGEKIILSNGIISHDKAYLFGILADTYANFRKIYPGKKYNKNIEIINIWSTIHGFTVLTVCGKIEFADSREQYAEEFMRNLVCGLM
ncbi:MAG: TetR/AcrR family transcriptional regulator [Spirochaetes bacterium]|nr:TetR/AcrR family transcriptional regulator [Spirochaetota bacterium]